MSIFAPEDIQQSRERASRNIAPTRPTGFWENMRTTWEEFNNNDRYGSLRAQRRAAWDKRIERVKELTGETLETPWNRFGADNFAGSLFFGPTRDFLDPDEMSDFDRMVTPFIPYGPGELLGQMFDGVDNDLTEPQRLREHEAEIDRLRERLPPERRHLIPTRDEIEKGLQARAQELEARSLDLGARATVPGLLGRFAGAGAASIVQPEVLVTLPFGASLRATILTRVLTEASIGAGTEAILQPGVQAQRAELGVRHGPGRALENVASAAAGAGGLTLAGVTVAGAMRLIARGGVPAFERVMGRSATPEERALVHHYQRDADVAEQAPYENRTIAAERVHAENEQIGYEAALETRPLGDDELAGDGMLRAAIAETGTVRLLRNVDLERIEVDADLMQFKTGADEFGVTERLKGVEEWVPERAGLALVYEFADGRQIIADGHQRLGLARRLAEKGQEIEMPAIILREADDITPIEARARAAFKNIAEGTGTAADAAKVLRDIGVSPEQINLPPRSALVRDAEGLRRLDDETFRMVINDVLSEQFGAIIGRLIDDPRLQPEIARLLARLRPANAVEADSIVRQARAAGVSRETQATLFGDEEVVQSLFLEKARVLDRSMKMISRNIDTFRTLNERGTDIQAEGNVLNPAGNEARLATERSVKEYIQRQAHRKGVIGDALNQAAAKAKDEGNYAAAAREFVAAITRAVREGSLDGDALSRGGADPRFVEPDSAASARPDDPGRAAVPSEEVLDDFAEPVSKASDEQALAIHQEILDAVTSEDVVPQEGAGWRFIDRETGEIAYSTQQRSVAQKANTDKYIVIPDAEHLRLQNAAIKAGAVTDDGKPIVPVDAVEARVNELAEGLPAVPENWRASVGSIDATGRRFGVSQSDLDGKTVAERVEIVERAIREATEPGADGKPQRLIPGVEPVTDADRLKLRAEAPLRGANQEVGGLFGDDALQSDLMDLPIPTGERIQPDGTRVAETQTVREALDDLEQDQEFIEQLKLCDRGGRDVA